MLRHRFPSYRRLMRDGEARKGVIVEVDERHAWELGSFKWRLRIRVVGDDAAAGREFTAMADTSDLLGEFPHTGDIWPVRLGRGADRRADIDLPALQGEITTERARIEAEHLRLGLARAEEADRGSPGG
jgi:hypothetical protein